MEHPTTWSVGHWLMWRYRVCPGSPNDFFGERRSRHRAYAANPSLRLRQRRTHTHGRSVSAHAMWPSAHRCVTASPRRRCHAHREAPAGGLGAVRLLLCGQRGRASRVVHPFDLRLLATVPRAAECHQGEVQAARWHGRLLWTRHWTGGAPVRGQRPARDSPWLGLLTRALHAGRRLDAGLAPLRRTLGPSLPDGERAIPAVCADA